MSIIDPSIVARALVDTVHGESPQAVTAACDAACVILKKHGQSDSHGFLRTVKKTLEEKQKMKFATLSVATSVTSDRKKSLQHALEKASGKAVDLTIDDDPTLLGGAVLRIGDELLDTSVKSEIDSLVHRLLAPLE